MKNRPFTIKKSNSFKNGKSSSFTIIELLVVLAIIGLLSVVVLAAINQTREKARIAQAQKFEDSLRAGLQEYFVGWWNFNEGSGNTASDSWSDNDMNLSGAGSWVSGIDGSAFQFTSARVMDFGKNIGNAVTYTFWFRIPGSDIDGTFLCSDSDLTDNGTVDNLGQAPSSGAQYAYGNRSCGGNWINTGFNVADTKWHHYSLTKSSSNSKLCLDGICTNIDNAINNNIPDVRKIEFNGGCGCGYAQNFSPGIIIDNLRIYSQPF